MSTIYRSEEGAHAILERYRELLDAWPVPSEHVRLPTREGETFVVSSGPQDAPPVLLLHGSGSNTTMWSADVAAWARHLRVHAVDIIGEPGLSAPSRPPMDSDAYALWLDDVLDGLGLTAAAFVGTSLGGWVALDYAARRPQRVARLAVQCPAGVGRQKTGWLAKALVLRMFGRRGVRRSAVSVTGMDVPKAGPIVDDLVRTFTQFKPRVAVPVHSDAALRRLTMPVLVKVGAADAMFDSAGTAQRIRACAPHATVDVLPGVGHAIFGQTASILEFLRDRTDLPDHA